MRLRNNINLKQDKTILTACLGQCVHVAGIYNFMRIVEQIGYKCHFLGPAVPILNIIKKIKELNPEIIGLSYRLTPKNVNMLLKRFFNKYDNLGHNTERIFFAGTPEVVKQARKMERFDAYFVGGESKYKIISILRNDKSEIHGRSEIPLDLISRIKWKRPYPLLRAHFGLPNLKDTITGIEEISKAEVIDVISIAPDQNTQANYFHPEDQDLEQSGAGGVHLRLREDFLKLHNARLRGNTPLLRIYAGTRDFIKLAELYKETIKNAWAAIPVFWFNQMDGRGPLSLKESIKQHLEAIRWHGKRNIPVEINDPHHWSLRDAPDVIAVTDMYLCGIIAKKLGVKDFIAQYMFNTPPGSSFDMDLAKMMAKDELLQTLADDNFRIIKQVRTGLASFPLHLNKAKGQLAAATLVQLALKPDIVHVVSFSEANHAATSKDVIESCNIVEQVINRSYSSCLDLTSNKIIERKQELITQAKWIVNSIPKLAFESEEQKNPYLNYEVLSRLVEYGIFDAPHLKNNEFAMGEIESRIIKGACYSWDSMTEKKMDEIDRVKAILKECSLNTYSEIRLWNEKSLGKVKNQ